MTSASTTFEQFDPLTGPDLADPYPFYASARELAPVFFSDKLGVWVVTRYEDALTVLRDPAGFSSRDTVRNPTQLCPEAIAVLMQGIRQVPVIVNTDPPAHDRLRRAFAPAFVPRRIAQLEIRIRETTRELVEGMLPLGRADLIERLALPLPLTVICDLFGVPRDDRPSVKKWSDDFVAIIQSRMTDERQVECARSVLAMQGYFAGLVAARRASPEEDLISDLVRFGEDGTQAPLSEAELLQGIPGVLLAGHETTTGLIGNLVRQVLERPAVWDAVRSDPLSIAGVVEETLRIDTSVPGFIRTATADVTLGNVSIPAGAMIFVAFGSANHDGEVFPEPEEFDLNRQFPRPHMAFGFGTHYCLGAPLARLEGRICLEVLAELLPGLRLVDDQPRDYVPTLLFRSLRRLLVEWPVAGGLR